MIEIKENSENQGVSYLVPKLNPFIVFARTMKKQPLSPIHHQQNKKNQTKPNFLHEAEQDISPAHHLFQVFNRFSFLIFIFHQRQSFLEVSTPIVRCQHKFPCPCMPSSLLNHAYVYSCVVGYGTSLLTFCLRGGGKNVFLDS